MTKATLTLSLALAVSVLINILLWRREPQAVPAPSARPAASAIASSPALPIESPSDVAMLHAEIRKLKDQLAASKASEEITKKGPAAQEHPDAREYNDLFELVRAFIETRKAQGVDQDGNPITFEKQVLTPENREGALRLLAEYVAPDDATRRWFRDRAEAAILQHRKLQEEEERDGDEYQAVLQRLNAEQRYEDIAAQNQKFTERSEERLKRWERDHLQPMRKVLDGRDGVRPALMSRHLGDLLWQLITPDER